MTTYRIDLPWTRPPLHENQRLHWAAEARIKRDVRNTGAWLTKAANIPATEYCQVTLYWAPGDHRIRDEENPTPTSKYLCDGIVDAGIVPDDAPRWMKKHMPVILPPPEPAGMWLEVTVNGGDTP